MVKYITFLLVYLLPFQGKGQVAKAGKDQTIYLSSTSTATLNGSKSSATSYKWTEVSTDYMSGATISNSTSKVATVSSLPQGVFYFQMAATKRGTTVYDTTMVNVNVQPPPNGFVVDSLPLAEAAPYANNRDDTTCYTGYGYPNYFMDPKYGSIFFERSRSNGARIDNQKGKLYTTIEDGYAWNGKDYARSEMYFGSVNVNPSHVMMYEWKGYFPQSIVDNFPTGYPTDILVAMQWHGGNPTQPPFQFNINRDWFSFLDKWVSGNGNNDGSINTIHIMSTADANVMRAHTLRVWLKEGTAGNGWIKVQLDGVTKYYRDTGQVGSNILGHDFPKFAGVYDYNNTVVDVNNHTRNKKFSLVTESYKIYQIRDASESRVTTLVAK